MRKYLIILATAAIVMSGALPANAGSAPNSQQNPTAQPGAAGSAIKLLDSIQNIYGPVKFDHATHIKIAGSCFTCHHEHPANYKECENCHKISPETFKNSLVANFMPCKGCHGKYEASSPGMPGLKAAYHRTCFKCHLAMMDPGLGPKNCSMTCHAKRANQ